MSEQTQINLTPSKIEDLRQQAIAAAQNAYAPYSHFRVGAAIRIREQDLAAYQAR